MNLDINELSAESRLSLFMNVLNQINSVGDFDQILSNVLEQIKSIMTLEAVAVFLLDTDSHELLYESSVGNLGLTLSELIINKSNLLFKSSLKQSIYSNKPSESSNLQTFSDYLGESLKNILMIPIKAKGKSIGIAIYLNKSGKYINKNDIKAGFYSADFLSTVLTNKQLYHDSQAKAYEVAALYEMTVSANKFSTIDEVLKENISVICEAFEAQRVSIILKVGEIYKFKSAIGLDKSIIENGIVTVKNNILSKALKLKRTIYSVNINKDNRLGMNKKLRYNSSSFISAPLIVNNEVIGFVSATERANNKPFRLKDANLFEMLVQQISENYSYFELLKESKIKDKLSAELVFTGNLQQSILPTDFPAKNEFEIAAKSIPSENVGGDFYDFIDLGKNKYAIVMADVSGKGLRAGLFMSMTRSIIRVYCSQGDNPANILRDANKQIYKDSKSGMFVTIFLVIIDANNKKITYSNGGHLTQYLLKDNKIIDLHTKGKPLGVLEDSEYKNDEMYYKKDDTMILFTDGVTETFNLEDEEYGEDRLKNIIEQNGNISSKDMAESIINDTIKYRGERSQFDDITLIVNKFL